MGRNGRLWTWGVIVALVVLTAAQIGWPWFRAKAGAERLLGTPTALVREAGFRAWLEAGGPVPALDAAGAEVTLDPATAGSIVMPDCARSVRMRNISGPGRMLPDWVAVVTMTCPYVVESPEGPRRVVLHREDWTDGRSSGPDLVLRALSGEALQREAARLVP